MCHGRCSISPRRSFAICGTNRRTAPRSVRRRWPRRSPKSTGRLLRWWTGSKLRAGLGRWITYYNTQRPHSGLAGRTRVEAYRRIGQSDHGRHASHDLMIKQAA
ncbi:integrase core domain-containing protein [Novosphingobium sp. CF614]|uniref:integrase core domain-containing protein n=1 Tax=Novosphingobium sp. CF614 TaxID=1884364 RepID=UPI003512686E